MRAWDFQPWRPSLILERERERERERVPKTNLHFLFGLSIIVNFVMSWRWIWPVEDEGCWWRLGIRVLLVWVEERDIKYEKNDIFTPCY